MVLVKRALEIGINAYPGYPLHGCLNDAADYTATLQGFQITKVLDKVATKTKIMAAMNTWAKGLKSGDNAVLAYSGHGSGIPDTNGDEPDAIDECIVSVDLKPITDDEIRAVLAKIPSGVIIDVFLDCCYSGTGTRYVGKPDRFVKGYKYIPPSALHIDKKRDVIIVPTMKHEAWTACKSNELSAEIMVEGVYRGAFSYFINRAIRAGGTRAENIAWACEQIASLGLQQTPQLETPLGPENKKAFT